jgi:hypothetical protein
LPVVPPISSSSSGATGGGSACRHRRNSSVAFLAGTQSNFIGGQVLRVDGGLTLLPG